MPVSRMQVGDRFLTQRSGMVTVITMPRQDSFLSQTWEVGVRTDQGVEFTLVGLRPYHVTRGEA